MSYLFLVLFSQSPSIPSPITLIKRPRVSGPTGTVMGQPVSFAFVPLINPSVESIAIVRTEESPKC